MLSFDHPIFMSNITVIISSMYPSVAAGWNGTETINGLAIANGVDGGYRDAASSNCGYSGECISVGSHVSSRRILLVRPNIGSPMIL